MEDYRLKFGNVHNLWGIDNEKVLDIIDKYSTQLQNELTQLEKYDNLPSYFSDRRSIGDYINNIIEGWLMEDLFKLWLESNNHKVVSNGDDSDRVLQSQVWKITSKQDFIINSKLCEFQYSNFRRNSFDVKSNKINKLIESDSKLLFLILPTSSYFLIDKELCQGMEPVPNPLWGGKMCYNFNAAGLNFRPLSDGGHINLDWRTK